MRAMISDFWRWWMGELRALLPRTNHHKVVNRLSRTEVLIEGASVALYRKQSLSKQLSSPVASAPVGDFGQLFGGRKRRRTVVLSFAPDQHFSRTARVPRAALSQAEQILNLDLKRLLPIPSSDLLTGWYSVQNKAGQEVDVTQVALRKTQVQELVEQLSQQRVSVAGLAFRDHDSKALPIVLENNGRPAGERVEVFWRRLATALLLAFMVAAGGSTWLSFSQQSSALAQVSDAADKLRAPAAAVRKKIEQIRSQNDETAQLLKLRSTAPHVPAIWDELAKILPDDAWLTSFTLQGPSVSIDGEADNPEQLVQKLEASSLFKNARFAAPVTNDPSSKKSQFSLTFDLDTKQP